MTEFENTVAVPCEDLEELMAAIDEELDNCIRKFRNAVYGYEVRTFIAEYEELMLKKSSLIVQEFVKKEREEKRKDINVPQQKETIKGIIDRAKRESRQALYLSITALVFSIMISVIRIALLL